MMDESHIEDIKACEETPSSSVDPCATPEQDQVNDLSTEYYYDNSKAVGFSTLKEITRAELVERRIELEDQQRETPHIDETEKEVKSENENNGDGPVSPTIEEVVRSDTLSLYIASTIGQVTDFYDVSLQSNPLTGTQTLAFPTEAPASISLTRSYSNQSIAGSDSVVHESIPEDSSASEIDQTVGEKQGGVDLIDTGRMEEEEPTRLSSPCRYRWSKILDTVSAGIAFVPSYAPNEPILLSWNEEARVYFSTELQVICGDHHGNLVVDGKDYPLEEYSVRSYSFEIDLYIKDDVIEDCVSANRAKTEQAKYEQRQVENIDTCRGVTSPLSVRQDASVNEPRTTSRIDEHFKQQVTEQESVMNSDTNNSLAIPKHHSQIGDDERYSLSDFSKEFDSKNIEDRLTIQTADYGRQASETVATNRNVIEDIVVGSPHSNRSSQRGGCSGLQPAMPETLEVTNRGTCPPYVGSGYHHASVQGSGKQSPTSDAIYGRPESKSSARFAPVHSIDGGRPSSSANRQTPISDHGSDKRSYMRPDVHTSPVMTNGHIYVRDTPPRSTDRKRDKSFETDGDPASRYSSRPANRTSSHSYSRPQSVGSMSSEVELAQYLDTHSHSSSLDRLGPPGGESHPDESLTDPPIMRGAARAMSVPLYDMQYQLCVEKQSLTPDNRVRVLPPSEPIAFRSKLVSDRTVAIVDRSSVMSNVSQVSSRTVTPTCVSHEGRNQEKDNGRIQDMEKSVSNLRNLLSGRETEVYSLTAQLKDVKDINKSLKADLKHRESQHTLVSYESTEFKQLLSEKEILAKEVVSLREDMARLASAQTTGSGRNSVNSGISDYSPNHPSVLQRKIVDLEAHMHDLQEANETTTHSLNKTQEKLRHLQAENRELKHKTSKMNDIQVDSDQHLRVQLMTLREDVHSLKERNFNLTEENLKLYEGQRQKHKEITPTSSAGSRHTNNLHSETRDSREKDEYENSRDTPAAQLQSSTLRHHHSKLYREDLAPKSLRQSLNRGYDSETRLTDNGAKLLQERDQLESSRIIRQYPRESSTATRTSDSERINALSYIDRSKPDGEVSEKLYSDHRSGSKTLLSYERKAPDNHIPERIPASYTEKYSYRGGKTSDNALEKYRQEKDTAWDKESKTVSGTSISSADIFVSLQKKRTNQWSHKDNKYSSGNMDYQQLSDKLDDLGDDSDTATDILLAQDNTTRCGIINGRRNSVQSDGSISSLSDVDEPVDSVLRRRSKSVDNKRDTARSQQSTLQRSGSATRTLTSMDNMRGSAGHRSVVPTPLVTQHNKGDLAKKGGPSHFNSTLTNGLRPFAPRNPADIRTDDVVKFSRVGGKLTLGMVKFIGHLPGRGEVYLGVQLDRDEGKHDGMFEGIRYFRCKPNKGVFVAFNKLVMAWAP